MSQRKDPNQGEGDKISARRYDDHAQQFVAEGKVDDAATEARNYVERDPAGAAKAEREAKRGPRGRFGSVDDLVAKGHSVVERVRPMVERARPMVERAVGNLRKRFGRR